MPQPEADHTHVSPAEAREAADPLVGDGTPDAGGHGAVAPDLLYVDDEYEQPASWRPTRKWWAATVTGAAGVLTLFATHGWHLDEHTTIALITVASQRAIAYLIPNEQAA